jgi:hypothetical protein
MPTQIRFSLDQETIRKILKGAGITAFYSVAVFILSLVQGYDFGNAILNGLIIQLVPTAINALKEWYNGEVQF